MISIYCVPRPVDNGWPWNTWHMSTCHPEVLIADDDIWVITILFLFYFILFLVPTIRFICVAVMVPLIIVKIVFNKQF